MTMTATPRKILYIGGTGTISTSSVHLSVAQGMQVFVLNRGHNARGRQLPGSVTWLIGDITDRDSVTAALGGLRFDVVVNFLCFNAADAAQAIEIFRDRTRHYVHISTASMYRKPILQVPIVESNLRQNGLLRYAREKIAAEDTLMRAHVNDGFPVTIVRPSHTYDEANPPLAGGWTVFDRIERGAEIVVHGDGTSLWTLTHAADLAQGLVGLLGNQRAIGEAFHITSDDVYTWDQIYSLVGASLGVPAKLVHVPSEFFPVAAPDWGWSELFVGDLGHSAIFDTSKIRRYVPGYAPSRTFVETVVEMARWRSGHPAEAAGDPTAEAVIDRMALGYHEARTIFERLAPDIQVFI
ncbi:NAD-dependent epimerase/dehydratase family protein [Cryobacterium sp. TMT2-14]|uniref:NAD-dependent epimerase/dehydratase family protein n=1 Tax=Cryobacterium sp. TMT2-14 TaxID=1259245 RepID=UPI0010691865|nr:NAD-dependent epimerase/dehydratase family protein [Cryobacterium sp. TMT2-14]TFC39863.1 NAD-dependent epimerase/dehydratase family protein [Cryobacterium sp. TMT2-14]